MTVTLDTCAQEPIHIPGSIQPHGVLYALRGDRIIQHSANAPNNVLGLTLRDVLDAASCDAITHAAADPARLREVNPIQVTALDGTICDAVLHLSTPEILVIEMEADGQETGGFDPRLRASVIRLQSATDVNTLCVAAAEQVRALTGFDRVMVYRFDPDWHGHVVAEDKRADLEPFLGQHYPASDIPEQARRLYTVNWLRFIADVAYKPVPMLAGEAQPPLDMSFGVLRSVSPIHIEYLKNMGVTASMSVSLVIDGVLAGLIACHHYSGPRLVSFRTRDSSEYLGRALSWQLRVLETADRAERAREVQRLETELVRSMATSPELLDGLVTTQLPALADARGSAVVLTEGTRRIGETPNTEALAGLVRWLANAGHDVFHTDHAVHDIPIDLGPEVAGVLAVAIARDLGEYILWFRPPTERAVDWAGKPEKVERIGDDGVVRLSPRGSFALWREIVQGRAEPWDPIHVEGASNLRKLLLGGVRMRATELRTLNQRLLDADRAKDDFIATVSHELRTPLHSILGWTQIFEMGKVSPEKLKHGIEVIGRNARVQTQLVEDLLDVSRMVSGKLTLDVETVDLVDVIHGVIESVEIAANAKAIRIKRVLDTGAQPVLGDPTRLRQVVSNLLTNAIKFTPKQGAVTIALVRRESDIELCVSDTGVGISKELLPLVFDVFKQGDSGMNRRSQGLGLGLALARKLVELHGGRIRAESDGPGTGATFFVRLPMAPAKHRMTDTGIHRQVQPQLPLERAVLLVVDDEPDGRDLIAHLLREAGADVTAVPDVDSALDALAAKPFTAVVSDIGMPGRDGLDFMRSLRRLPADQGGKVPAVALTAYSRAHDRTSALQAGFDAHVPKPVDAQELVTVVASIVKRIVS